MKSLCRNCGLVLFGIFLALASLVGEAQAQRPTAPQLLPTYTLAAVRITDMPTLTSRFQQTALGQISQDDRMKPLVGQIFQGAKDAFKQVEERIGLPLDQLLKIPQGEVCVGFVASENFDQEPGFVVVIDTKDQAIQARKLLAAAEEIARKNGGNRGTERIGGEEVDAWSGFGPGRVFSVERDGTFVFATNKPLMETVLANFNGEGIERTLADYDKYNTVMDRCLGQGDEQPQISWYVDPIALIRRLARGSLADTGLALFPVLGLDGLQAVGGTMTFATGEFDEVQHIHVLLDNPRVGVIDAIGLRSGDTTPESWVPGDCVTYSTIHWDLRHTFNASAKLYNGIMGEGELENQIRSRISDRLGVDFEKEIMPQLSGRATMAQWVEKPVRINSIVPIVGLQLKDPQAFKHILDKIVLKHSAMLEKQRYGTVEYWLIKTGAPRQQKGKARLTDIRQPMPCIGIVNDYLLMSDSMKAFQEAITAQTNPDQSLPSSLDFKLITSRIQRQPGGDAPGAITFSRPEEGMRFWYEMANAESTRKGLSQQASRNRFFGSIDQALKDHPLPPFEVIAEYMAPGGGMIVNDQTGIHYTTFTLKRK